MNSRLDTLQAAVLLAKLKGFEAYELDAVNRVAKWYDARLTGAVTTPHIPEGCLSSWAQYTIQLPDRTVRDGLQARLKQRGIPTMIYYPRGLHQQTAFASKGFKDEQFPRATAAAERVLSLPMHPDLTEGEVAEVCGGILDTLSP